MPTDRTIALTRMVLPDHECPFGLRTKRMLEERGLAFEEHILATREEVDAFKAKHGVATTPQLFVDGERIGGSEDAAAWLQREETGA